MELLKQQIQALIFCSEQSISLDEIASSLKLSFDWELSDEEILSAIEEIRLQFESDDYSFELVEISEGYQFLTKKQYYPAISALIQHKAKKKLSVSQMETLAIIAYRQPISKAEVEHIRGVSCDYAVQKLLEKELVEISGKSDGPGRPVLYSTSTSFMDYFGIKSVKDLPQLKDLHVEGNEIGNPSDSMVDSENTGQFEERPLEENENPVSKASEDLVSEELNSEVSEITDEEADIDIEETAILADTETALFENSEVDIIASDEDFSEELTDDFPSGELPDRKSIYLENELNKEINQEEEEDRPE